LPCPIDRTLEAGGRSQELGAVTARLQAAQKAISRLSKRMKPCYTFVKFGDCRKVDCRFLHAGGVLIDGVWTKAKEAEKQKAAKTPAPAEDHPEDDAQTAAWRAMPMSKLRKLAEAAGVSKSPARRRRRCPASPRADPAAMAEARRLCDRAQRTAGEISAGCVGADAEEAETALHVSGAPAANKRRSRASRRVGEVEAEAAALGVQRGGARGGFAGLY
jgi:hypothetical protein